MEAVTGSDGVARGQVPLDFTDAFLEAFPDLMWRVLATFDGEGGAMPAHEASPLTLVLEEGGGP